MTRKHVRQLLIGGLLVILFVGLLIIRLMYRNTSPSPVSDTTRPAMIAKLIPEAETVYTAASIAKSTVAFLNAQRQADGLYPYFSHYETICPAETDPAGCPLGNDNVREEDVAWVILARLAYYQKFSHDPADLKMAESDMSILLSHCRKNTDACASLPLALAQLYTITKNDTYQYFLRTLPLPSPDPATLDVSGLALASRALAAQGKTESAGQFLQRAWKQAEQERVEWTETTYPYVCDLALASADIAPLFPSSSYLADAFDSIRQYPLYAYSTQTGMSATCLESAFLLGESLSDPTILQEAEHLLQALVAERWDEPGYPRAFGEGGFLSDENSQAVTISDAAQMLIVLSHAPQKIYRFPARTRL